MAFSTRGRGGHKGGPKNDGTGLHGVNFLDGKHHRYCCYCSWLIPQQNLQKTSRCPRTECGMMVPARGGWSKQSGVGRCENCDSFMHKTFLYCQICKWKNVAAFDRKILNEKRKREEAEEELKILREELALLKKKPAAAATEKKNDEDSIFEDATAAAEATTLEKRAKAEEEAAALKKKTEEEAVASENNSEKNADEIL